LPRWEYDALAFHVASPALFAERPGMRLICDREQLETMSPLLQHNNGSWFFGDMVFILTEENAVTHRFRKWVRTRHSAGSLSNP
jgi:hypothetical protein